MRASRHEERAAASSRAVSAELHSPIHVVLAYDEQTRCGYVVTVYVADPELWSDDFTTRRDR